MGYYRVQHSWRDQYNPLRGLTIQRIIALENATERGNYSDLQWFWGHMHQTDVTVSSTVAKRLGWLSGPHDRDSGPVAMNRRPHL